MPNVTKLSYRSLNDTAIQMTNKTYNTTYEAKKHLHDIWNGDFYITSLCGGSKLKVAHRLDSDKSEVVLGYFEITEVFQCHIVYISDVSPEPNAYYLNLEDGITEYSRDSSRGTLFDEPFAHDFVKVLNATTCEQGKYYVR